VQMVPKRGVKEGSTRLTIVTAGRAIPLLVRVVDRAKSQAYDRVEFYDDHAKRQFVKEACDRELNTTLAQLYFTGGPETRIAHEVAEDQSSGAIVVKELRFHRLGKLHQFHFLVENNSMGMLPIQSIRMFDSERQSDHIKFIEIDAPPSKDPSVMAEIPPGEAVAVYLQVDAINHLGPMPQLMLMSRGKTTTRWIYPFGDPYAVTPLNKDRISVQAQVLGGAVNLMDPRSCACPSEFTTIRGLGVRGVYGVTRALSLESSVSVLSTGDADFDDMQASATTGRMLLGGMLHVGDKYVSYVRVGVGARVSSYTATLADGSTIHGGGLFSVGTGFDAWLGDSVAAGLSTNFVGGWAGQDDSVSFEVGIHAGYAWNPPRY